jgi:exodeoxyribonuclease V gamma subunit
LLAWVRLLALSATWPERPFTATTVGRSRTGRGTISIATIGSLGPDPAGRKQAAESHLQALVEVFQRGMREPLPVSLRTTAAWAAAVAENRDPDREAAGAWTSDYNFDKEDKEAEHILVHSGVLPFGRLVAHSGTPMTDEAQWAPGEPTRFGVYALRLWGGLLQHEAIVDR